LSKLLESNWPLEKALQQKELPIKKPAIQYLRAPAALRRTRNSGEPKKIITTVSSADSKDNPVKRFKLI